MVPPTAAQLAAMRQSYGQVVNGNTSQVVDKGRDSQMREISQGMNPVFYKKPGESSTDQDKSRRGAKHPPTVTSSRPSVQSPRNKAPEGTAQVQAKRQSQDVYSGNSRQSGLNEVIYSNQLYQDEVRNANESIYKVSQAVSTHKRSMSPTHTQKDIEG